MLKSIKTSLIIIVLIFAISCKKENDSDTTLNRVVKADIRDSVYYYSEAIYLWYKNLKPATVTKPWEQSTPEAVMGLVRATSEIGLDGKPKDRWSFVLDKKEWDNFAAGTSADHGVDFLFGADGYLYVRQVFEKSSAGLNGIQRGWKVLNMAGIVPKNDNATIALITQKLAEANLEIEFEKPDQSKIKLTINTVGYQKNMVQSVKMFEKGDKKIGYFVLTDFLGDGTSLALDNTFNTFKDKNVNELVVDLRYNGGGYVSLAEKLANLIAPVSINGKIMYTYAYNDKLSNYNKTLNFKSLEKLNLKRVVFITTKRSASASELIINALKPHIDVKIIGSNSHGKPVGFPVIPVMGYVVAPVAFKTVNSKGEADYYQGFTPDYPQIDDVTKNFGDDEELCLKTALAYLNSGNLPTLSGARVAASSQMEATNDRLPQNKYEGMFTENLNKNDLKALLKIKH